MGNKDWKTLGCLATLLYFPFGVIAELTKKYSGGKRK